MRRRTVLVGVLGALVASCDRSGEAASPKAADRDDWIAPPRILGAALSSDGIAVRGEAAPAMRIVLRSTAGDAFAAMTDRDGAFVLTLPVPKQHVLFQPEIQNGEASFLSPEKLLVLEGGQGPIALLRAGAATRRLDSGGHALGAIDSDAGQVLLSGQMPHVQGTVRVVTSRGAQSYRLGPDGFWQAAVELSAAGPIEVAGQTYDWPGPSMMSADLTRYERVGQGWRIVWQPAGGGVQTSWLPDKS